MDGTTFAVLGPLEVCRAGERVVVPGGRRRAVLGALLVHAGAPVSADALVDAGWGDEVPADPNGALYTVISRLRSLVGPDVLTSGPAGYRLDIPDDALDARRFEALWQRAAEVGAAAAAQLLDEALALWRGRAYNEIADRDVVRTEAERLELLRADAVEERARVALDLGDAAGAVRRLEELLARQPFREQAVGLLMTALVQADRTADALARYQDHRRRMAAELGLDPSPVLEDLRTRMLRQEPAHPRPPVRPPAWVDTSTAMFGREAELAALLDAVTRSRLVTVVGAGGVGKTRLVAEALAPLGRLGLPIVVVELAVVGSGGVDGVVGAALGVEGGTSGHAAMVDRLRSAPALVVLDNCEHLLAEVAALAAVLTRRCPQARIVATSRHRLGLATERVVRLTTLPQPRPEDPPEVARSTPAVQLLIDRVRRARPDVILAPNDVAALSDVARLLDGLPLALELVASRVAVLGADAVRAIRDRGLPTGTERLALRAMVDWSCRLLTDEQRQLLATLTVFVADFDLPTVCAVARRLWPWSEAETTAMFAELVDSSLVVPNADGGSYRLLAVVRDQVEASVSSPGTRACAQRAHAGWLEEVAERIAQDCTGPRAGAALRRLQRLQGDIVAAITWAMPADEVDVAASVAGSLQQCPHWTPRPDLSDLIVAVGLRCRDSAVPHATVGLGAGAVALAVRGELDLAAELGRAAAEHASSAAELYLARLALGLTALYGGDLDESRRHWQAITGIPHLPLALATEAHSSLALLARYAGDLVLARDESRIAVMLAETAGSAPVHAFASYAAGEAAVADADRGIALLTAAAQEAARIPAAHVSQVARMALLAALVRSDDYDRARTVAATLIPDLRGAGAWPQVWTTLRILAEMLAGSDQPHDAALLLAATRSRPSAPPPMGEDIARYATLRDALRRRIGPPTFDRIDAAARASSCDEVADRALALVSRSPVSTATTRTRP